MAPLFFSVGAIALIWSGVRSEVLSRKLVDSFPPQFQDDLSSRYAFSVFALSPSTPLELQAEYMKCQCAGCAGFLCISLGFFFAQNIPAGGLVLLGFMLGVFWTFRSWKTYQENCNRTTDEHEEQ